MDDEFKKKVLIESRERQALAHPCILPIKEVYNEKQEIKRFYGNIKWNEYHYVVSPLAMGGTLEEMIDRRRKEDRPMNEQELLGLFARILLAMEETHAQG